MFSEVNLFLCRLREKRGVRGGEGTDFTKTSISREVLHNVKVILHILRWEKLLNIAMWSKKSGELW
jgi:hypothetical protein